MNERYERAFGSLSWLFVNESNTASSQMSERGANVIDAQGDVVQSRPAPIEKPGDGRFWRGGLEQLQRRLSNRHEMRTDVL
jgi:hypothetical protein